MMVLKDCFGPFDIILAMIVGVVFGWLTTRVKRKEKKK